MNEPNNSQPQSVIAGMLQRLHEDAPESDGNFTLTEDKEPQAPAALSDGDVIELGKEFDYDGFQVVRREFFAHTNEPSITFNNFKVYVNAACLSRFQAVDYVQVLVNSDSKILAIRPCMEEERDAFSWCVPGSGRRKPRQITCRLFFAKVFSLERTKNAADLTTVSTLAKVRLEEALELLDSKVQEMLRAIKEDS